MSLSWVQNVRYKKGLGINKKSKMDFLLQVILFLWPKAFKHILVHLCWCKCVHVRNSKLESNRLCFALFACFFLEALSDGIAKTATGKECNECKILGELALVFKYSDTDGIFKTVIFLIPVVRNSQSSSAWTGKPATTCAGFVYITVILN